MHLEALEDSTPDLKGGRFPFFLSSQTVFNFAMDVILVLDELHFITDWMQKIKLCA